MRRGLVFNEKKSSSSGPGDQAPWVSQQVPGALLGSVLGNNVLEAWGLWLSCRRFQILLQHAPEC